MKTKLKQIPEAPGIYKFFSNKELIYIGKAKNLKKRTSSYFTNAIKDRKTNQIKKLTDDIEVFITNNEVEALLLEQNLIKENKPKFNILLRDDKTYPYIYFSKNSDFPGIYLKRTRKAVNKDFIGPFTSVHAVKNSMKEVQKIFQIRNCSDNTMKSRTRPCIEFQMKRCSAPCTNNISKQDYAHDLDKAINYLTSSKKNMQSTLIKEMQKASDNLDFEKAGQIKKKLKQIEVINERQNVTVHSTNADVFAVTKDNQYAGICIVSVRDGKIRGTKTHLVKDAFKEKIDDLYQVAIFSFYATNPVPDKIFFTSQLDNLDLIKEAILTDLNSACKFPKGTSGFVKPILSLAVNNASQIIQNHLSKEEKYRFAYAELQAFLGRKQQITRIDAIDISHQYRKQGVGAYVSFNTLGKNSADYRLFNLPDELTGNDVGSMEHVIERKLKYFAKGKPDILLIDGGMNQLNFVHRIIENSDYKDIKLLSIAKGFNRLRATETIFSKEGIVEMDLQSKAYLLLQEIRDESHRFAITASRKKKFKQTRLSSLDHIAGIGPVTKKRLLKKFKNLKTITASSKDVLMTVPGINETIALEIKKLQSK